MSRLRRLRSFWRSALRPQSASMDHVLHSNATLIRPASLVTGTPPGGGLGRRSVFTVTRARGTRTPETATTADFSSYSVRRDRCISPYALIWRHHESSFTAPGSYGSVTAAPGVSGVQPHSAT